MARSSEFVIFSGLVPGLLEVKFASLHDLYWASRSCYKVLDELIPEVLLSTLKPCINTKLQNRHARMNLLYQGGQYQWIRYKSHANTEGKLMARLMEFHRQHACHGPRPSRSQGELAWDGDSSCEAKTCRARWKLVVQGGDLSCKVETCRARRRLVRGGPSSRELIGDAAS
jgi:hypothetical protein